MKTEIENHRNFNKFNKQKIECVFFVYHINIFFLNNPMHTYAYIYLILMYIYIQNATMVKRLFQTDNSHYQQQS